MGIFLVVLGHSHLSPCEKFQIWNSNGSLMSLTRLNIKKPSLDKVRPKFTDESIQSTELDLIIHCYQGWYVSRKPLGLLWAMPSAAKLYYGWGSPTMFNLIGEADDE